MSVKNKIEKIEETSKKNKEVAKKKIQKEERKIKKDSRKKEDLAAKESLSQWLSKEKGVGGTPIVTPVRKIKDKIRMFETKKNSKKKGEERKEECGKENEGVQRLRKMFGPGVTEAKKLSEKNERLAGISKKKK